MSWFRRIPAAVWAALAAAVGILLLVLRGRRLEAELVTAKLREQQARSRIAAATSTGRRQVYEAQAGQAAVAVKRLEVEIHTAEAEGEQAHERVQAMTDDEVAKAYQNLTRRASARRKP